VNVAAPLQRSAREHGARLALVQGDEELTYAELAERVARLAGFLRERGLERGDRVGILQWNGPRLLETLLAAFHGGFVAVPVNARATPYEAAQVFADAEPAIVVHGAEYAEHVEGLPGLSLGAYEDALGAAAIPCADLLADELAWLFYTSGTTGSPKGAMLTHRNLLAMSDAYSDIREARPEHVVLHAAPLTHGSGLYALPPLAGGATQVITTSRAYEPEEILRTVAERGATDIAFLTPTMVKWLVEAHERDPGGLATLENVVYGGGPMYRDDLVATLEALGPVFSQIYGQAEAPVTISRLTRDEHRDALAGHPDRLASAGRPYRSVEVAVDEGEILARGDVVMRGYWRNEEASAETLRGGWLHTGDLGRIDDDGFLYLLDRSKDMIISGGANIYPREVEEVILEHPAVRQVAVLGAPDDDWGERVVAVLALHDGGSREDVQRDVDALCRARLAGYKRPRQYDWLPELPTSSYGKILKRELRDTYWQGRERSI
jgi:acyl-CoA synthetase (AMP-forming)/AMP-acid ligase II